MNSPTDLDALNSDQLRALARQLMTQVDEKTRESHYRQTRIDQLTDELSVIKRLQFGRRSEQFTAEQLSLLDEAIDEDLAALEAELDELRSDAPQEKPRKRAKRLPLPPQLPRTDIHHEPTELSCSCGCQRVRIGEDISEKLDYTPGVFTVERHIRGKWACKACETLIQAPVPPHVIDKGIPTNGLLAQVLVAKYGDHLPLYRQERIFARAGLAIPQSTLGGWVGVCGVRLQPLVDALREELLRHSVLHADETPVRMLSPGKGKTHSAYLWAYTSTQFAEVRAVVYEFADGRSGEHARAFLGNWRGKLVVDDYSGYKAGFKLGITEIGCMAHARRKFFDLHASKKSQIAEQALKFFVALYDVEREAADLDPEQRRAIREERGRPIAQALHVWMLAQRKLVAEGSPIAKALDYNLKRWQALTRYLDDPHVPIGRVEMWRGGGRVGLSVAAPFVWRCPNNLTIAPFPHPAHRTGRADFPHPALFQNIRPSRSNGWRQACGGVSVPMIRKGTGQSIGGTPFPFSRVCASTRPVGAARRTGCEWRSESDTRWRRQSETLNDLFFRTGFSTTGGGADGQVFGCVGRSPKGECRRARCCSRLAGVTRRAGCGRRSFTYRRTNRSDTGPNCQVHSGVEPNTRTTGHECAPSIARLVSPVDNASALTGILDAGVRSTVRVRALSGTGHCLPPLRPRPNLLQ